MSDQPTPSPAQHGATQRNTEIPPSAHDDSNPSDIPHLTPQQFSAIELLLRGLADAQIADQLHVHRGTIFRWRTENRIFQLILHRLRQDHWAQSAQRLRALVPNALDILESQMADPKSSLRAAATLLRFAAPKNLAPPTFLPDDGDDDDEDPGLPATLRRLLQT